MKIVYDTYNDSGKKDKTTKEAKHPPHKDFITAMQDLKKHALLIAEWNGVSAGKFKKIENYEVSEAEDLEIRIIGITLAGEDEKAGVIITVYRTLSTGLGFVFNTPLTKFENEGETKYKFIQDLGFAITDLEKHADEYLAGKYGVMQGELFEQEHVVEE